MSESPAPAPGGPGRRDWAAQTADTIEHVVGVVRSNTVDRVETVVRLLVYGLVAGALGVVALVLFAIFLMRLLEAGLDLLGTSPTARVWLADLVLGAILTVVGALLWSKKSPRPEG